MLFVGTFTVSSFINLFRDRLVLLLRRETVSIKRKLVPLVDALWSGQAVQEWRLIRNGYHSDHSPTVPYLHAALAPPTCARDARAVRATASSAQLSSMPCLLRHAPLVRQVHAVSRAVLVPTATRLQIINESPFHHLLR